MDGPLSELKRVIIPEGDDSIERCPAVLNPSVWDDPVPVWSRQAAVDLLKVIISKSLDHLDSQVHHLTLGVLATPGLVRATHPGPVTHQHEAVVTFV